jgi:hypothetical protein
VVLVVLLVEIIHFRSGKVSFFGEKIASGS